MSQKPSHIHYCSDQLIIGNSGPRLLTSTNGTEWETLTSIRPVGSTGTRLRYGLPWGRLGQRLFRSGVRHVLQTEATTLAVLGRRFYRMDRGGTPSTPTPGAPCIGSNPLCAPVAIELDRGASGTTRAMFYGEYRPNPERSPVHVWRSDDEGMTFSPAWRFDNVRHVHGVFTDPFESGVLWVTTGDDDHESAIYRTDDQFATLEPVVAGSQQTRAVDLIFTADAVYFGSDTPREQNWWHRLDRTTGRVERQIPVRGSVFWATTTPDGWRIFSTVVEKSEVNTYRYSELIVAPPGHDEWRTILRLRKDPFHDKFFDHGQIRLPAGPGRAGEIWITPYAVAGDQTVRRIDLAASWRDQT